MTRQLSGCARVWSGAGCVQRAAGGKAHPSLLCVPARLALKFNDIWGYWPFSDFSALIQINSQCLAYFINIFSDFAAFGKKAKDSLLHQEDLKLEVKGQCCKDESSQIKLPWAGAGGEWQGRPLRSCAAVRAPGTVSLERKCRRVSKNLDWRDGALNRSLSIYFPSTMCFSYFKVCIKCTTPLWRFPVSSAAMKWYHCGIHFANNFTRDICQLVYNASYYAYYCVGLFAALGFLRPLKKRDDTLFISKLYTLAHCHVQWGIKHTFNVLNKSIKNTWEFHVCPQRSQGCWNFFPAVTNH